MQHANIAEDLFTPQNKSNPYKIFSPLPSDKQKAVGKSAGIYVLVKSTLMRLTCVLQHPFMGLVFSLTLLFILSPFFNAVSVEHTKDSLPLLQFKGNKLEKKTFNNALPAFIEALPQNANSTIDFLYLDVLLSNRGRSNLTAVFHFKPDGILSQSFLMNYFEAFQKITGTTSEPGIPEVKKNRKYNYGISLLKKQNDGQYVSCLFIARKKAEKFFLFPRCYIRLSADRFLEFPIIVQDGKIYPDKANVSPETIEIYQQFFKN